MTRSCFCILAVLTTAGGAGAYTEPPWQSYTRLSPDKRFVFVMLHPPRPGESDGIAAKFPKSGLYRNDGSAAPVWVYPEGYTREAYPASDGVHLVVQHLRVISHDPRTCGNSPPEPPANPVVLTVYAGGKKVRDVQLDELLDHVRFVRDRGPGWHPWLDAGHIDDATGTFVAETVDRRTTRIDLATGRRIDPTAGRPAAGSGDPADPAGEPIDFCGTTDRPHGYWWGLALGVGLTILTAAGTVALVVVFLRSRPGPGK